MLMCVCVCQCQCPHTQVSEGGAAPKADSETSAAVESVVASASTRSDALVKASVSPAPDGLSPDPVTPRSAEQTCLTAPGADSSNSNTQAPKSSSPAPGLTQDLNQLGPQEITALAAALAAGRSAATAAAAGSSYAPFSSASAAIAGTNAKDGAVADPAAASADTPDKPLSGVTAGPTAASVTLSAAAAAALAGAGASAGEQQDAGSVATGTAAGTAGAHANRWGHTQTGACERQQCCGHTGCCRG